MTETTTTFRSSVGRLLLLMISGYRLIVSPWMPPRCRFTPSCSAYASQAIAAHGPWLGLRLAIARLARCHPWHPGGHDPVPLRAERCCSTYSDEHARSHAPARIAAHNPAQPRSLSQSPSSAPSHAPSRAPSHRA